ncbi:MAG: hypothetical protein NTY15_14660 [Planctomycetota bacterium]|nr:hypothetical protein [Planctomycetota bacterium]
MEVSVRKILVTDIRSSSNSFDCDSAALDAILGLNPIGQRQWRVDSAESAPKSHLGKQPAQVYVPLDVVPAASPSSVRGSKPVGPELLADAEFKRERLVRLLDRQQAWYDAQQQAARAAEQLLSLCEHHQQQWLLPNQPTLMSPPPQP